jgi:LysM repeat protein
MKKKTNRLMINLAEIEKYKHNVAMVNQEAEWNQHEPNSGMARMFFVMLLIHIVVIGGIIVYDWLNGEDAPAPSMVSSTSASTAPSALPPPAVNASDLAAQIPIEDCATYEWKSGDSIASVAKKLGVTEEVLIRMNMLDKGTQLENNSIIRYPKQPVVKAVALGVAGANGELPVAASTAPAASIAAAESPMALTVPGEQTFSFSPTIENELAPTPGSGSAAMVKPSVQETPPAAVTQAALGEPAAKAEVSKIVAEAPPEPAPAPVSEVKKEAQPKIEESPPSAMPEPRVTPKPVAQKEAEVPKAIPVSRNSLPSVSEKAPAVKKKQPDAVAKSRSYTVKPGETLYSIAMRNGTSVKALQAANKIAKPESLRDGMKLVIPAR